jgi:hypothetical protein
MSKGEGKQEEKTAAPKAEDNKAPELSDDAVAEAVENVDVVNETTDEAAKEIPALQEKLKGDPAEKPKSDEGVVDKQLKEGPWSKSPEKEMERVFRVARFPKGVPYKPNLATRMTQASVVDGIPKGAISITIAANHALQYVLEDGAVDYSDQLNALRVLESKGFVKEVNPKYRGVVWLPPRVLAAQKAKAEYEARRKELELL